jgi:hypothetical protein
MRQNKKGNMETDIDEREERSSKKRGRKRKTIKYS